MAVTKPMLTPQAHHHNIHLFLSRIRCPHVHVHVRHRIITIGAAAGRHTRTQNNDDDVSSEVPNTITHGGGLPSTASAKLFADAAAEEKAEAQYPYASSGDTLAASQRNWDGEESIHDAVLRMLVDKHKPLRTADGIRSADAKLKEGGVIPSPRVVTEAQPAAAQAPSAASSASTSGASTTEVPPPPTEHKPWLTTFRAPSHSIASIYHMRLPPPPPSRTKLPLHLSLPSGSTPAQVSIHPDDTRSRNLLRDAKRKALKAGRLTSAVDSSLDYKLGKQPHPSHRSSSLSSASADPKAATTATAATYRPNPISLKGWAGLIEERIERARQEGLFRELKGRGKPIQRETEGEYGNPFIAREEFLMNRIVRRQGAAPPWVEYQAELDTAVLNFRTSLRQTLTRQTLRHILSSHPLPILAARIPANASDPPPPPSSLNLRPSSEFLASQFAYHTHAVNELNALIRRYNAAAPYAVRRGFLTAEGEVEGVLRDEEWRKEVWAQLRERVVVAGRKDGGAAAILGHGLDGESDGGGGGGGEGGGGGSEQVGETGGKAGEWRIWRVWERIVARFV